MIKESSAWCSISLLRATRRSIGVFAILPPFTVELTFLFTIGHRARKCPAKAFRTLRQLSYIVCGFAMRGPKLRRYAVSERKADPARQPADAMPRWVKIFGAVALIVIAIIAGLH